MNISARDGPRRSQVLDGGGQGGFPVCGMGSGGPEASYGGGDVGYGEADTVEIAFAGNAGDFAGIRGGEENELFWRWGSSWGMNGCFLG